MSNQIGINETMAWTAPALCTNSRIFVLKILCTEFNDWKHGLYSKIKIHAEIGVLTCFACATHNNENWLSAVLAKRWLLRFVEQSLRAVGWFECVVVS